VKCPDCGLVLVKTAVVGLDDSYRCGNCGGVWVKAWVINEIAGEPYNDLKISKLGHEPLKNTDKPKCPADGEWLALSQGDTLPPDITIWECGKCKCRWLPSDSVFDLASAFRVKAEFNKRWRKTEPVTSFALPVVLTVVLALGLGVAVVSVRKQQDVNISAGSAVVGKPTVIFMGEGKAEIRFKTAGDLQTALVKRQGDSEWLPIYVLDEGAWKALRVDGINLGEKILVSLDQKVWQLTIGQKQ
jgi:hypothetical protein